jgi:hypothetical protein
MAKARVKRKIATKNLGFMVLLGTGASHFRSWIASPSRRSLDFPTKARAPDAVRIERERWFDARNYHTEGNYTAFGVAPDGRLLMIRDPHTNQMGVIRRWDLELVELAPANR